MTTIDRGSTTDRPQLKGRSLLVARILWFVAATVTLAIFAAAVPAMILYFRQDLYPPEAVIVAPAAAVILSNILGAALGLTGSLMSLVLSGILFWRGDRSFIVFYTSLYLLGFGIIISGPLELAADYHAANTFLPILASMLWSFFSSFPTIWLLWIFPNGHHVPGWTRTLILPALAITVLQDVTTEGGYQIVSPLQIATTLVLILLLLSGFVFQVYRYFRVSTRAERQQTKWVLIGIVMWFMMFNIGGIGYTTDPTAPITTWRLIGGTLWTLAMIPLPLALTVSVLRYRLWGVDVIIRRTLTYGSITVLLGITYFGGVALLQSAFVTLTGQQSPLAVVASTLAIAALFNPLRSRVQTFVDRRFYRSKYDAERTLEAFAESLRDEVEIEHLQGALVGVVEETMQPESVSLWIRQGSEGEA